MSRGPRLGDLALALAAVVLAVAAYHDLHRAGQKRDEGLATFSHALSGVPGTLTEAQYRRAYRVVSVCALHHRPADGAADYRLCGILGSRRGAPAVVRWYSCALGTRCAPPPEVNPRRAQ